MFSARNVFTLVLFLSFGIYLYLAELDPLKRDLKYSPLANLFYPCMAFLFARINKNVLGNWILALVTLAFTVAYIWGTGQYLFFIKR